MSTIDVQKTRHEATRVAMTVEEFVANIGVALGLVVDGQPGETILRFSDTVDLRVTVYVEVDE